MQRGGRGRKRRAMQLCALVRSRSNFVPASLGEYARWGVGIFPNPAQKNKSQILPTVQKCLGHKDPETTLIYTALFKNGLPEVRSPLD